ncbi:Phosphatidate cytidylyltransferase [compost metagenome]
MLSSIYPLVVVYFLIGAIAIAFINKKGVQTGPDRRNRWVKYVLYLIIVNAVILSIHFSLFYMLVPVIAVIAVYEFARMSLKTNLKNQFSFGIPFLIVTSFFVMAALQMNAYEAGYVYTLVFCFDGFAQIIGQLLGKRQITPKWSPNKTVAGFAGAFLVTVATSVYYCLNVAKTDKMNLFTMLLFGVLISLFAFSGDILASLFKRVCGEKDYSNLLPQHGGVLDRFDSFIFALAGYYCLSQLLQFNGF